MFDFNLLAMAERVMQCAHGGQILCSEPTFMSAVKKLEVDSVTVIELGTFLMKGLRQIKLFDIKPKNLEARRFPEIVPV